MTFRRWEIVTEQKKCDGVLTVQITHQKAMPSTKHVHCLQYQSACKDMKEKEEEEAEEAEAMFSTWSVQPKDVT